MTTFDEAPADSLREYDWGLAPSHLKTRRQLREMGKSPGKSLVGFLVGKGSKPARLFDSLRAPDKRVPSPAQLDAIAKVTREHQLRAAERRGFSRADLDAPVETAPSWEHTPTPKEGKPMSDNMSHQAAELAEQPRFGEPVGHSQRLMYLLATVAVNQARHRDARLAQAVDAAQAAGPDAVAELLERTQRDQASAESRMETIPWHNPAATVETLADALYWQNSSEIAADRLSQLADRYANWGVLIDPDQFATAIDPAFDAGAAQTYAEAHRLRERESSVIDFVSAMSLPAATKGPVIEAIMQWRSNLDAPDPGFDLRRAPTRREELAAALSEVKLSKSDRDHVGFVVDYLRGDTSNVDLLDTPVLVDPSEEVRGRVPRLLEVFAGNPKAAKFVGEEIAVMTPEDQEQVREVGRQIVRGGEVDFQVWPGYLDRYDLAEEVAEYAACAENVREDADYLAAGELTEQDRDDLGAIRGFYGSGMTVTDDVNAHIARMAELGDQLRTKIRDGQGLAAIERAQLTAVVNDIDAGRIPDQKHLPELLFADERSKTEADVERASKAASRMSAATRTALARHIEAAGVEVTHRTQAGDRLQFAISGMTDSIYIVACGSREEGGLEQDRKRFVDNRARLNEALGTAGVEEGRRTEIREMIDHHARVAGKLGRTAAEREQQWKAKVERVVAARNDSLAQRQAANAGQATPAERARAPRTERVQEAHVQAQSRAVGRRQLHTPEVGR